MPDSVKSVTPIVSVRQSVNESHPEYGTFYHFEIEGGRLYASLTEEKTFTIHDIEVDRERRRNGLGKALLTAVKTEANQLQVRGIHAILVSREVVDAVTTVFGEDSLTVTALGSYAAGRKQGKFGLRNHRATLATLWYVPSPEIEVQH